MNYQEAKLHSEELNKVCDIWGAKLDSFEKGEMGLTPNHVRALPEYQEANREFKKAFAELRKFNSYLVKTFKKELAIDRDNRRKKISK